MDTNSHKKTQKLKLKLINSIQLVHHSKNLNNSLINFKKMYLDKKRNILFFISFLI